MHSAQRIGCPVTQSVSPFVLSVCLSANQVRPSDCAPVSRSLGQSVAQTINLSVCQSGQSVSQSVGQVS